MTWHLLPGRASVSSSIRLGCSQPEPRKVSQRHAQPRPGSRGSHRTRCTLANTDPEAWSARSQAGIPTLTQPSGILPSSWPSWIPQTRLPEHPPSTRHFFPVSDKPPPPPPPQTSHRVWGAARAWRRVPSGTKRFFSWQDRFQPASPSPTVRRGTYKGKPPGREILNVKGRGPAGKAGDRDGVACPEGMGRKPRHVGPGALSPPPIEAAMA